MEEEENGALSSTVQQSKSTMELLNSVLSFINSALSSKHKQLQGIGALATLIVSIFGEGLLRIISIIVLVVLIPVLLPKYKNDLNKVIYDVIAILRSPIAILGKIFAYLFFFLALGIWGAILWMIIKDLPPVQLLVEVGQGLHRVLIFDIDPGPYELRLVSRAILLLFYLIVAVSIVLLLTKIKLNQILYVYNLPNTQKFVHKLINEHDKTLLIEAQEKWYAFIKQQQENPRDSALLLPDDLTKCFPIQYRDKTLEVWCFSEEKGLRKRISGYSGSKKFRSDFREFFNYKLGGIKFVYEVEGSDKNKV